MHKSDLCEDTPQDLPQLNKLTPPFYEHVFHEET